MRHTHVSSWTALAIAASIAGAAAQAGAPRPVPPAPDAGRTVTLRGCLQSWDGSPTGIGRGDVSGAPMQFVLTNVEEAPGVTPPTATGTAGTASPPAAKPAAAHDTFVVQPADSRVRLQSHLDQQVQVIGTLEVIPAHDASAGGATPVDPPPAGAVSPSGAPASGVPGARTQTPAPQRSPMQRVLVTSVATIAKSCP
jgi:hypothetical protein